MHFHQNTLFLLVTLSTYACVHESHSTDVDSVQEQLTFVSASEPFRGFSMAAEQSRFRLGANARSDESDGFVRSVGDEGVIAIGPHGALLSVPNAGAPSTHTSFVGTASEHERLTRNYFVGAGLPEEQIGHIQNNGYFETVDNAVEFSTTGLPHQTQQGYYTVVQRHVSNFPVVGSYAWARLNSENEVVSEEVYWPEFPGELLIDAEALTRSLPEVLGKLPIEIRDRAARSATVVISHSPFMQENFEAFAALLVPGQNEEPDRRFDISGRELLFQSEQTQPTVSLPKP
jgi:hypothetical protein